MGVEDRFQMTLVKSQVQSVESINNIGWLVNFCTGAACLQEGYEGNLLCMIAQTLAWFGCWNRRKSGASPLLKAPGTHAGLCSGLQLLCAPFAIINCKYLSQRKYTIVIIILM